MRDRPRLDGEKKECIRSLRSLVFVSFSILVCSPINFRRELRRPVGRRHLWKRTASPIDALFSVDDGFRLFSSSSFARSTCEAPSFFQLN